ncbi:tripartite motif-containing protein 16-like [Brienomyrus brachyistius]|uniref:tripartite motif-containing protein 16-like n=1 Tax=Brienomyrus brachyistius TaxID=42636 RepID=UPI0020B3C7BB|nr:tripartite motif-containing protein 16-like [Brienomyrus brachyistius]
MAEASITGNQNQLSCPICLDLLKDPVTIPCRHSYCMSCIKSCWDQEDHLEVYSCPQCRETFTPRPVLGINTILAEVVENLKKTGIQSTTQTDHYAGPGDVECDFCTGRKCRAVKFCLVCLASYCETHLQPHYESPAFKKHKLADPTGHLLDKVCSLHDKPLESYCRTDKQCICFSCEAFEHRGHDTIAAAAERADIQKDMGETQTDFQQRIQVREKELQELREAVESITTSAQSTVEVSERIFTEMIHSIERTRSEVTELIRDQEKAAVNQVEEYMERLEQEIDELKRRHSEMEQLSRLQDHIHFLQRFQGIPVVPEVLIGRRFSSFLPCYFWKARKVVSDMKDQLENSCTDTKDTLLPPLVPRTRAEFLQYSCWLTLDHNTANRHLRLSEDNRMVTWRRETQSHPDHEERFDLSCQVLCRESLTGRCYWEVEWSGTVVGIAVAYKGINRKVAGVASRLGYNDKSWCLSCSAFSYSFWHNTVQTAVSGPPSSRIGVYLDHGAGNLSFYSVSDTVTLLHRVQTTFTEPVYPGVVLYNSEARL